jgi:ATP-dependent exoDNAse (exonuclease V) beta subunit
LLESTGALLAPIMGTTLDSHRPFYIPFTPLLPERNDSRQGVIKPFVECILAGGEDSEIARSASAHALATRLVQLKELGEIGSWDEVALLFRASTPFSIYEQALEDCGIPYVTIAGSGFYERPEVRDLLNMLRAIADPWDDQAMAGMLRSPAIGVSDVGIYQLRQNKPVQSSSSAIVQPLRESLKGDISSLSISDQTHVIRAISIMEDLESWVDRLPVAALLKRVVDKTDYRATLATCAHLLGSARLWRNVDKLINDAHKSGAIRVRAFLEYIATMRDVGARESEAASEAEGVLRLMTIHKAKGLEFPIVVLADANRRPIRGKDIALRIGDNWAFGIDKVEGSPLAFRLAKWQESLQSEAEDKRLLYVALTRAREKLIINGHLTIKDNNCKVDGWLSEILDASGILPDSLIDDAGVWKNATLPGGAELGIWFAPSNLETPSAKQIPILDWPESKEEPLYNPLNKTIKEFSVPSEEREHKRLSFEPRTPPARVVGEMVHKALQCWLFPGDSLLEKVLRSQAKTEGLIDEKLIDQAIREAHVLLNRFQQHPLYTEMNTALERYHEVPFIGPVNDMDSGWGFIDCFYRTSSGWVLIDFKTDELRGQAAIDTAVGIYTPQLLRYENIGKKLINKKPNSQICFLNTDRGIQICKVG